MSYLANSRISSCSPFSFMEQNPSLINALLADCNFDRDEVVDIVKLVLETPNRCQITSFYIEGLVVGQTSFLVTNLNQNRGSKPTAIASTWLLGRDATCAITVPHLSISRCHAFVGYDLLDGFYITDVGSSNGTWVNRRRLLPRDRRILRDGDLLQLGDLKLEFFLMLRSQNQPVLHEPTYS